MAGETRTCSVCSTDFEICFRYQVEERTADNNPRYFCSQRCLEASHSERTDGSVSCDACATSFQVELAAHVLFTGGRRHYACSPECRTRVLSGVRAVRLGELNDPRYLPDDTLVTPAPSAAGTTTPTPPPASTVQALKAPLSDGSGPRVIAVF